MHVVQDNKEQVQMQVIVKIEDLEKFVDKIKIKLTQFPVQKDIIWILIMVIVLNENNVHKEKFEIIYKL